MRSFFARERLASASGASCSHISYFRPVFHHLTVVMLYSFKVSLSIFLGCLTCFISLSRHYLLLVPPPSACSAFLLSLHNPWEVPEQESHIRDPIWQCVFGHETTAETFGASEVAVAEIVEVGTD